MAGFLGHRPGVTVLPSPPQIKLVPCPNCGYKEAIIVDRDGDQLQIKNFKEPRRCGGCGQIYQLTWRLDIAAAKLGG